MSNTMIVVAGFSALFAMMLLRVPIGIAMGIVGVAGFSAVVSLDAGLRLLLNAPMRILSSYTFSVVPMFILMGIFASAGGMSAELFRASNAWLGHIRGGLATASIMACGGFSAINGSSIACAATMTTVALPEMRKAGYDAGLGAGIIAAGGTLGALIPPSVFLLLYGILTEQPVVQLFLAAVVPGVLGMLFYMATIQVLAVRNPASVPAGERAPMSEKLASLRSIWAIMLLFISVIVAMYGGFVTVTEAAAVGVVGAFVIGVVRGRLSPSAILQCLIEALRITASIFTIAIGAVLFGYFLTVTQVTQNLTAFLVGLPVSPMAVLTFILIMYLLMGAVMDELATILLTLPIVFPAIVALGFDPIWFGVVLVTTVTVGMITPPVGMNVFVINSIAKDISLVRIYAGVMPFVIADIIKIVVLVALPSLSLFLPRIIN